MRNGIALTTLALLIGSAVPATAGVPPAQSAQPCAAVPPPTGEIVDSFTADVDGDGAEDEVISHRVEGGTDVQVQFAAGGSADAPVTLPDGQATGAHDIDRDGDQEVVLLYVQASLLNYQILTYDDCRLDAVQLVGDYQFLEVGGPQRERYQGFECRDGVNGADLRVFSGTVDPPVPDEGLQTGPPPFDVEITVQITDYALRGGALEVVGTSEYTTNPTDADYVNVALLRCGSVLHGIKKFDDVPRGGIDTGLGGMATEPADRPTSGITALHPALTSWSHLVLSIRSALQA